MDVQTFIQQTNLLATGKPVAPAVGSTKYNRILSLGNLYTNVWAKEPGVDWNSLRGIFNIGTVNTSSTYDLDPSIGKISNTEGDFVIIDRLDGKQSRYTIVPITRLNRMRFGNADGLCARQGNSLVFSTTFTTTHPDFGGTIQVPGYILPDPLVGASDELQIDDPWWLCFICAAEVVRNDVSRQNQYPNLVSQAINSMNGMKEHNMSQREEIDGSNWTPLGSNWD